MDLLVFFIFIVIINHATYSYIETCRFCRVKENGKVCSPVNNMQYILQFLWHFKLFLIDKKYKYVFNLYNTYTYTTYYWKN